VKGGQTIKCHSIGPVLDCNITWTFPFDTYKVKIITRKKYIEK
jgi:hypothetical protein